MANSVEDRRRLAYTQATSLTQDMLDETFRGGENQIEAIGVLTKTVDGTTYTLRFADRPKFVGDDFYEGRASFPTVKRTMGDLVSPSIKFAQFEVELGNMDGFYNEFLVGGANYFPFTGARLEIKLGLRDEAVSFITVFDGLVPEEDGFEVSRETLTIRATDKFNDLNKRSPLPYINDTDFPSAPQDSYGKIIPMVLGDWTAGWNFSANAGSVSITDGGGTSQNVRVDAPSGFYGGTIGYYVGGGLFVFSIGTYIPEAIEAVFVKRGEAFMSAAFNPAAQSTAGYWSVEVTALNKVGGGTVAYVYQNGDEAVIKVKVPYAGSEATHDAEYDNIIRHTVEVLKTLGGRVDADLDLPSFAAYEIKAGASADFTTLKARLWIGDEKDSVLGIALSLLEQVRMEMFVDRQGLLTLRSLHPDDFPAPADATRIDQFEIDEDSVSVSDDESTFFNQAWINYAFTPVSKKTELSTGQRKNQTSIDKAGKRVIKVIDAPNLYVAADAEKQLDEFLRLYSTGLVYVSAELAWVHLLRDLGDFIAFNYEQGSLSYTEAPMEIRDIGVNLQTGAVSLRLLSFANFPYDGFAPDNAARFLSSDAQSITSA